MAVRHQQIISSFVLVLLVAVSLLVNSSSSSSKANAKQYARTLDMVIIVSVGVVGSTSTARWLYHVGLEVVVTPSENLLRVSCIRKQNHLQTRSKTNPPEATPNPRKPEANHSQTRSKTNPHPKLLRTSSIWSKGFVFFYQVQHQKQTPTSHIIIANQQSGMKIYLEIRGPS
ncbi:hypothetical protein ACFX2I_040496 [Malus domestica]